VRSSRSGWGFKIDYAAAIADDDRRIAFAASSIKRDLYRRSVGILEIQELWQLALHFPDVSAALGMSDQDVADLAAYIEYDIWACRPELPAEQAGRVGYGCSKANPKPVRNFAAPKHHEHATSETKRSTTVISGSVPHVAPKDRTCA
jgi:hypothetical protein